MGRAMSDKEPQVGDLAFACQCGSVRGVVHRADPSQGDYVVCHCTDCQAFAHYCHAGDQVLDPFGGSHLFQSRCARMTLSHGTEQLACLHLTDKPTLRWYTKCCRTPLFNTYRHGRVPYVTTFLANCDPTRWKPMLGPPLGHVFLEEANGQPDNAKSLSTGTLMRRFFVRAMKDLWSGDRKRSALFDALSLEPIATPHRLSTDEQASLYERTSEQTAMMAHPDDR